MNRVDRLVLLDRAFRTAAGMHIARMGGGYAGAPHGLTHTHKDQLTADLLAFVKG